MWKQINHQNVASFRRTNITPTQLAFIVDQYLNDNNFSKTRSEFCNEASSLFANLSIDMVPKNWLSLEEMMDEYIYLKEQKLMMDQERIAMMQERNRVQMLLQSMHNLMDAFNALQSYPLQPDTTMNANPVIVPPQQRVCKENLQGGFFSTAMISASDKKRKDTQAVNVPVVAKKPRGRPPGRKNPVQGQTTRLSSSNRFNNEVVSPPSSGTQSSVGNSVPNELQVQGFSVPRLHSSHSDTPVATCNEEAIPSCSTVIPANKVVTAKQKAYIGSCHFDASNRLQSLDKSLPNEVSRSMFDKEFNLDFLDSEMDFSFSETLSDLEIPYDIFDHPAPTHSKDNASRSSLECNDNQVQLPTSAEASNKT